MSDLISYELEDGVATLTLSNGKVNAVSPEVITAFHQALDQAEADQPWSSSPASRASCPADTTSGDAVRCRERHRPRRCRLGLARRMLSHPFPIIVACSGTPSLRARSSCCPPTYRVGVEGPFRIGLNEVQIGMTMHHVGIELARNRLRKSYFNRSVINAEMFDPAEAVAAGFLDAVVAPDDLMGAAGRKPTSSGRSTMTAHADTKPGRPAGIPGDSRRLESNSTDNRCGSRFPCVVRRVIRRLAARRGRRRRRSPRPSASANCSTVACSRSRSRHCVLAHTRPRKGWRTVRALAKSGSAVCASSSDCTSIRTRPPVCSRRTGTSRWSDLQHLRSGVVRETRWSSETGIRVRGCLDEFPMLAG